MSSSHSVDLQDVHDFLIDVAYRAGGMITSAKPVAAGSGMKKNSADLVTETDQAVERMVSSSLKEKYPEFESVIHLFSFRYFSTYIFLSSLTLIAPPPWGIISYCCADGGVCRFRFMGEETYKEGDKLSDAPTL